MTERRRRGKARIYRTEAEVGPGEGRLYIKPRRRLQLLLLWLRRKRKQVKRPGSKDKQKLQELLKVLKLRLEQKENEYFPDKGVEAQIRAKRKWIFS